MTEDAVAPGALMAFTRDGAWNLRAGYKWQTRRPLKPCRTLEPPELGRRYPVTVSYAHGRAWRVERRHEDKWKLLYPLKMDADHRVGVQEPWRMAGSEILYEADAVGWWRSQYSWRRPEDMPSEHVRTWARVGDLWIEGLHSITEDGARAEGRSEAPSLRPTAGYSCRDDFMRTWQQLYGGSAFDWFCNPYVIVYTLEVERSRGD